MKKTLLLCCLLSLLGASAGAQKAKFEYFTTADGLEGNNIFTVLQDHQGFIWFVNGGHLHRYDGKNFVVVKPPADLPDANEPFIDLALFGDSLLFVWNTHRLYSFDPATGHWQSCLPVAADPAEWYSWLKMGKQFLRVIIHRADRTESRLWKFQNQAFVPFSLPQRLPPPKEANFWCDQDEAGFTCVAYNDTFYRLDVRQKVVDAIPLLNIGTGRQLQHFHLSPQGEIVMMMDNRFYVWNRKTNVFEPHPINAFIVQGVNEVTQSVWLPDGSLWATGYKRSLLYYNRGVFHDYQEEFKRILPECGDFNGISVDKGGVLWINTRLGLLKFNPQQYQFDTYLAEPGKNGEFQSFRGMTEDAQGMMYALFYVGIAKFDPVRKQVIRQYPLSSFDYFDLAADNDVVWLNGGDYFDPRTGAVVRTPSSAHRQEINDSGFFTRDREGRLWWAVHSNLYYLQAEKGRYAWVHALELPEKINYRLEALHSGRQSGQLWISFKGKLLAFTPATGAQNWFDFKNRNINLSRILAIFEDPAGILWLGTDQGLLRMDAAKGTVKQYRVADGLPNDFICGLLPEGDSCLWLSTNHGLSRFSMAQQSFLNFFEEDGLSYNEFNRKSYFKSRSGQMFFGGLRGITAFYPELVMKAYRQRNDAAQLVLSSFEYIDERTDTLLRQMHFQRASRIELHHWDWSYTFTYALTDFAHPEEIYYSYKMEGYKDNWSAPSRFNFVRFNSLPPGEYVFRVKARDGRGRWHPHELAVKIIVYPPWWATWQAYLIYGLLAAGLAYLVYSILKKRLLLQNQLQLKQEESARLQELDHFKSRLYTNLTHEFRTPLTVILGMASQIRTDPKLYLGEGLRLIETNSQNLLGLINQLLDLSQIENKSFRLNPRLGNVASYLRYITESFQTYSNGKNLSLRFFSPFETLVMDYDEERLKQVMTNLISNAVKFTPSGGAINVRLDAQDGRLTIEVRDTGIGIDAAHLPNVFDRFYQVDDSHTREVAGTGIGLAHTQELVRLMGGTIRAESEPGKGSAFIVQLPVRQTAPAQEIAREPVFAPAVRRTSVDPGQEKTRQPAAGHPDERPQLLIIEDNPDVVVYLKACLESAYQLDVAYNGRIGIEKTLENIPDLIVCDVMMPEKDGYQVCDILKNDERSSHIPIILLTAKADADSRITGLRRGADAYLTKPFDKEELLVQLEMLVARQRRMSAYFSRRLFENGQEEEPKETLEAILAEDAFMQKVREIVATHYGDEDFALPQLCQKLRMSRSQLFRKMKALSDLSPSDYIRSYRLNQAKILLESTDLNVSEVAWKVGFKDPAHFSKSFQEAFGILPSATSK